MYQIEEENPSIIRYIVNESIYRIHQTIYVGFHNHSHNILYRQYSDIIWEQAAEYIDENINQNIDENDTFIVKSDDTFKYKSFFLIKKSDLVEEGCKVWNCMVYVFNKTDSLESLESLNSLHSLESYTSIQV